MLKVLSLFVAATCLAVAQSFAASPLETKVKTIDGKETTLGAGKPKLVLIVNTASKCGYTRQYAGLQKLYEQYKDQGLVIAGFPCNQFGGQEPGSNLEIKKFCSSKFSVTFPMFEKLDVNGDSQHPLYAQLTGKTSPFPGEIGWNFTKFLVDAEGKIVGRFGSGVAPSSEELKQAIDQALN